MPIAARIVPQDDSHNRLLLLPPVGSLFFRTGFERALRTSYSSHRIEATGFAGKKTVPLAARTIVDRASTA